MEADDKGEDKSQDEDTNKTNEIGDSNSSNKIEPSPGNSFEFKKPLLIGPRKGKIKFSKYTPPNSGETSSAEKQESSEVKPVVHRAPSPCEVLKDGDSVVYKEPEWSGLPTKKYYFEVIRGGKILTEINLSNQSFHVIGRSHKCDIIMRHPTVSRFHCVLQFRKAGDADNPPGYYVYDFGSANGTYLNKHKLKANTYIRVHVGHSIKTGLSSRIYLLQGPEDEPESDMIKQNLEPKLIKKKKEREELEEMERKGNEEKTWVDWGLGEDADEETDLTENPFAATQNEELYINDPKKTLRGWFEREGYDLEYNCQEKGFGQFVCHVELPIDNPRGGPVIAEAVVKGKKKEAVVQCALEACRILDQRGLLRQSSHESRKRKAKNWEDNDYYDSDEDTFLDRTGTVERKRQIRMEQAGVKANTEVHTYQSLLKKHEDLVKEIKDIETELVQATTKSNDSREEKSEDEDELDAYMSSLSANERQDKKNVAKLKSRLAALKQEEVKVRNLANVAKPAEMPKLKPMESQPDNKPKTYNKLPIIGKRKIPSKKPIMELKERKIEDDVSGEEVDSD